MTEQLKKSGRPMGRRDAVLRGTHEGSRRELMDSLEVGDSLIFVCDPGELPSRLQASISATYRNGESMSQQGLEQQRGMLVFEGEIPTLVTRVTRVSEPRK